MLYFVAYIVIAICVFLGSIAFLYADNVRLSLRWVGIICALAAWWPLSLLVLWALEVASSEEKMTDKIQDAVPHTTKDAIWNAVNEALGGMPGADNFMSMDIDIIADRVRLEVEAAYKAGVDACIQRVRAQHAAFRLMQVDDLGVCDCIESLLSAVHYPTPRSGDDR